MTAHVQTTDGPIVLPFALMPPQVAGAVTAVMAGVKRLAKDETNSHGKYRFAGIDAFLDATRPLCAEAGLIIVQDEDSFEIVETQGEKKQSWLLIRYFFYLAHSSGEMWDRPIRRSIMVLANMGAQAFGSAQSYAEKQFMRSLFQIATGDQEDADTHEQTDLPQRGRSAPREDFSALISAATAGIDIAESLAELDVWRENSADFMTRLAADNSDAHDEIVRHWKARRKIVKDRTPPSAKAAFPGDFGDIDGAASHLNGKAA